MPYDFTDDPTVSFIENAKSPEELEEEEKQRKQKEELEKLEEKLKELTILEETEREIYGREFMVTVREIERITKKTPCPLSQKQIDNYKLNPNSVKKIQRLQPCLPENRWLPSKSTTSGWVNSSDQNKTKEEEDNRVPIPPSPVYPKMPYDFTDDPTVSFIENAKPPEELEEEEKQRKQKEELEKLEEKLKELTILEETEREVYGREFMVTVREIERITKKTPCPLSPAEVDKYKLNPKFARKKQTAQLWVPSFDGNRWSPSKPTTSGWVKSSDENKTEEEVDNRNFSSEASSPRLIGRPKSENCSPEEEEIRECCYKIQGIFNKVTPTTKHSLQEDLIHINLPQNLEKLKSAVLVILEKCLTEPNRCPLFLELCGAVVRKEYERSVRSELLNEILSRFLDKLRARDQEEDEKRRLAIINMLSCLYRNPDFNKRFVRLCIQVHMIPIKNNYENQDAIRDIFYFLNLTGALHEASLAQMIYEKWLPSVDPSKLSSKNRADLQNLLALKSQNWIPKHPQPVGELMTVKEVRDQNEEKRRYYSGLSKKCVEAKQRAVQNGGRIPAPLRRLEVNIPVKPAKSEHDFSSPLNSPTLDSPPGLGPPGLAPPPGLGAPPGLAGPPGLSSAPPGLGFNNKQFGAQKPLMRRN